MTQIRAWRWKASTAVIYALLLHVATPIFGGPIEFVEQRAFIHDSGGLLTEFDRSSNAYAAQLDAQGFGSFSWTHTNRTLSSQTGLTFLVFVDADIDRELNTFFNEYGALVSLSRPPGAPAGAITASGWEIDEPGFVFGDIYSHLLAGELDNTNAIPAGVPDDVSLALAFTIGNLAPNAGITATFLISRTNVDGLLHADPDSQLSFYFNGYITESSLADPDDPIVPEPGTFLLLIGGLAALYLRRDK
jgi:hypothetical protein